jgi:hypothetical protein
MTEREHHIHEKDFLIFLPLIGYSSNDVLHQQQVLPSLSTATQHCQWRPVHMTSTGH